MMLVIKKNRTACLNAVVSFYHDREITILSLMYHSSPQADGGSEQVIRKSGNVEFFDQILVPVDSQQGNSDCQSPHNAET